MFKRTTNSHFGASHVDLFEEAVATCSPRLSIFLLITTTTTTTTTAYTILLLLLLLQLLLIISTYHNSNIKLDGVSAFWFHFVLWNSVYIL